MVYLICGSPCSGKSTYIAEHRKRDDLIVDVDRIYHALSGDEEHGNELYVHKVAKKLMQPLYDIVRNREGEWHDAYVISLAASPEQIAEAKERVNADEVIIMDTPYEVCMERAKERPFYFQILVDEWFATRGGSA